MRALLALAFAALTVVSSVASAAGDEVRLEVVLMRHGVRSPTKPASNYADYANAKWPEWPVAPGMLTSHGRDGMIGIGARLRDQFTADRLLGQTCPDASSFVVIGDSTPRNRESSEALVQGLAPGCDTGFLATEGASNNPLFHYHEAEDGVGARPARDSLSPQPPALEELQSTLLGCTPTTCPAIAKRDGKKLLPTDPDKATKLTGTLSENLMLAFAQGMLMDDVAFNRGGVDLLGRLITLHNDEFAATKKSMPAAAQAGSNLVAHIASTFGLAPARPADVEPLLASRKGIVVLVGHDTNLANVAGVLGLDWHDPKRPDDYPPGGALLLSLVHHEGHDVIRIRDLMPSMLELRTNRYTDMKTSPVRVAGCHAVGECTPEEFRAIVAKAIDATRVDAALPSMQWQHAPHM
ncbi:histidine-type phosphatase [Luteibacter sp.]|uniref:histidine-type phosphatase n=1 Tax=Luteibacter sp. TaxID=1886636 RepID=UPI002F3E783F